MHKFDPINRKKLDSPKRREMLPPKTVLEKLGLKQDDDMADIGCGIGYFTFSAAEIIDSKHKIYAIDISDEMLEEVKKESQERDIENISLIKSTEDDLKLEDEKVNFALMVNVLHETGNKLRMLKEIYRILRPDGRIAVVDFEKKETESGPPLDHRISKDEALELLEDAGFEFYKEEQFADTFYGIVAVKKA